MALTPREKFKVACLAACADRGLSIEETLQCVKQVADRLPREKQAIIDDVKALAQMLGGKAMGLGESAVSNALGYGIPLALLAPPLLGAAGGYGAAKLLGGSDESPDDIKNQEKIDAYRMATQHTRNSTQAKARGLLSGGPRRRSFRDLI